MLVYCAKTKTYKCFCSHIQMTLFYIVIFCYLSPTALDMLCHKTQGNITQCILFQNQVHPLQLLLIDSPDPVCVVGSRRIILLSSGELICWHGNQNANGCERRMHSIEIQIAHAAACNREQIHSALLTLLNFKTD